jgi:hypothetical protein
VKRLMVIVAVILASASVALAAGKKTESMKQLYDLYKDECAGLGNSSSMHFSMAGQEKQEKIKAKYNAEAFDKVCGEVAERVSRDPNMAAQPPVSFKVFKQRVQK